MKKSITLLFIIVMIGATGCSIFAQTKQKAKIDLIRQDGETITLTVTSPKEFYVGGNTHILYIGDKKFDLNEQQNEEGKGIIKFFIPTQEFKSIDNGTPVYLSYGELVTDGEHTIEEMCSQNFSPCWSLGKLNKKQLK